MYFSHSKENERDERVLKAIQYGLFEADFYMQVRKYKKNTSIVESGSTYNFSMYLFSNLVVGPRRNTLYEKDTGLSSKAGKEQLVAVVTAKARNYVKEKNEKKHEMLRLKWKNENENSENNILRYPGKDVVLLKTQEMRHSRMGPMYGYIHNGNPKAKTYEMAGKDHEIKFDFGGICTQDIHSSYKLKRPYYDRIKSEMCDILNRQAEEKARNLERGKYCSKT